jgi:aspartyl/asparaginyl beta-hydroxylase (cupin superfamily)
MERFVKIAEGLDVAPVLAELARHPEQWVRLNADESAYIPLLGADDARQLEAELTEVWSLIDAVRQVAAADRGDYGALAHCRVGRIPRGGGLPPHFDGIDGVGHRRYQLALQSEPGAEISIGGETKCLKAGEAWQIDVSQVHSVHNHSDADRIIILFDTQA